MFGSEFTDDEQEKLAGHGDLARGAHMGPPCGAGYGRDDGAP